MDQVAFSDEVRGMYFDQAGYEVGCEWGLQGVSLLAPHSDVVIVVDVISFSTTVDLAVSRGARVYPYRFNDESAKEFARSRGALLANASRRDPDGFSLAPSSMLRIPPGSAIVLPSPNGASLSLAASPASTFTACLRNASASAAAAWKLAGEIASSNHPDQPGRISVIPAGERWPDHSLRPALEDLLGAGAVIHALPGTHSPEARTAEMVFLQFKHQLLETLSTCGSGKEAIDRGSFEDVRLASELDASPVAPRLIDGAFQ